MAGNHKAGGGKTEAETIRILRAGGLAVMTPSQNIKKNVLARTPYKVDFALIGNHTSTVRICLGPPSFYILCRKTNI